MKNCPVLLLSLLLAAGLSACGAEKAAQGQTAGAAPPAAEVEVITAASAPVTLTQELPGRLEAVRTAQVRARVEGVVEKRLFAEGRDVAAGASLFRIDPRTYQAAADSAAADAAVAKLTVDRYKPLLPMKAVSQQEYDQAEAKYKQALAAQSRAQLDLENAHVPAPIGGRIGRAMVTEGALVGRGEATLLATIEQLDPIYADFTQSNADLLRLQQAVTAGSLKRTGESRVDLILEDGSIYRFPGKLQFADLAVDPNTGSIQLRAQFPNPKRELLPGTFVRIRVPQAVSDKAIKVPQRAVMGGAQGQYVMLVEDGKATPRPVKTASMAGEDWVVSEGLKGGEQVIVNGLQKARPGTPVKAVPLKTVAAPAAAAVAEKK
jgi:membrane fusion protein (multidrug efflux system)